MKKNHFFHSFRVGASVIKASFALAPNKAIFNELNAKQIEKITLAKANNIKKNYSFSKFYKYGRQIYEIEKRRTCFLALYSQVLKKETLINEFLTSFLVNSMAMEGGTVTYEAALQINNRKKIRQSFVSDEDILLYKQLKEAYYSLKAIKIRYPAQIKKLHNKIYKNLFSFAGKYRKEKVAFGNAIEPAITSDPRNIVRDYKRALEKYYSTKTKVYDFERIIEFHKSYEAVHGFRDGNSRLGRLIMAHQMMQQGYPAVILKGNQSIAYRNSLVRAINSKDNTSLHKLFYNAYCSTYDKFWENALLSK
ncbi:MAG: Fic family protein [archaeon]